MSFLRVHGSEAAANGLWSGCTHGSATERRCHGFGCTWVSFCGFFANGRCIPFPSGADVSGKWGNKHMELEIHLTLNRKQLSHDKALHSKLEGEGGYFCNLPGDLL